MKTKLDLKNNTLEHVCSKGLEAKIAARGEKEALKRFKAECENLQRKKAFSFRYN